MFLNFCQDYGGDMGGTALNFYRSEMLKLAIAIPIQTAGCGYVIKNYYRAAIHKDLITFEPPQFMVDDLCEVMDDVIKELRQYIGEIPSDKRIYFSKFVKNGIELILVDSSDTTMYYM